MSLILPKSFPNKRNNRLFTFAIIILLVLGGIAFYKGSNDFAIRSLGLIACGGSIYLVRKSKGQGSSVSMGTTDQQASSKAKRPGRLMWTFGAVSLLSMAASYLLLVNDANQGYHQAWPVYLFSSVMLVGGLFLSYLVTRMMM